MLSRKEFAHSHLALFINLSGLLVLLYRCHEETGTPLKSCIPGGSWITQASPARNIGSSVMKSQTPLKRTRLSLEEKLNIIKAADDGKCQEWLAREYNIGRSTVSTILQKRNTLLELSVKNNFIRRKTIRKRSESIQEMERRLKQWILLHSRFNIPLSKASIQARALVIYDDVKGISTTGTSTAGSATAGTTKEFSASNGWWHRFAQREELDKVKLHCEFTSADNEAAGRFASELAETIRDEGYSHSQIFNVVETGLLWKDMLERPYRPKEKDVMLGKKAVKDRITLLLGGNADGSLKLKPALFHKCFQPHTLQNCNIEDLPVVYKAQTTAGMTSSIFIDWFRDVFKREVEQFCRERQIPFKILLLLENAPGHPESICGMFEEIKVVFLPPNTTSLIQPMDQGVIANFKSYYLRNTFRFAIANLEPAEGDTEHALEEVLRKFNIADAIRIVAVSWSELTKTTMAGVWKNIILGRRDVGNIIDDLSDEICRIGVQLNLKLTKSSVRKLLDSHNAILTEEDIVQLSQESYVAEPQPVKDETQPDSSNSEALKDCIKRLKDDLATLPLVDKNYERGKLVAQEIHKVIKDFYNDEI